MLKGAVLRGADLRRANVRGADLSWADMAEADLRGADMLGALMSETLLRGARYNDVTRFPTAFDPAEARMVGGDGGRSTSDLMRVISSVQPPPITAVEAAKQQLRRRWTTALLTMRLAAERAARTLLATVAVRAATSPLAWFGMSAGMTLAAAIWSGDLHWPRGPIADAAPSEAQITRVLPTPKLIFVSGAPSIAVTRPAMALPEPATHVAAAAPASRSNAPRHRPPIAQAPSAGERNPAVATVIRGAGPIPMPSLASYGRPTTPSAATAVVLADDRRSFEPVALASPPTDTYPRPADAAADLATAATRASQPIATTADSDAGVATVVQAAPAPPSAELASAPASDGPRDGEITAAVEAWRNAWETRDLNTYVGLYRDSSAAPRRGVRDAARHAPQFSKARVQARATELFSEYDRIQVDVGRMDVRRDGEAIVSTFDQAFTAWRLGPDSAPAYVDRGRKTLVFAQDESSEWRIVSEEWRQLAQ